MSEIQVRKFKSVPDFFRKFGSIFLGPSFYYTFKRLNGKLREQVLLTVSVTNNCAQ